MRKVEVLSADKEVAWRILYALMEPETRSGRPGRQFIRSGREDMPSRGFLDLRFQRLELAVDLRVRRESGVLVVREAEPGEAPALRQGKAGEVLFVVPRGLPDFRIPAVVDEIVRNLVEVHSMPIGVYNPQWRDPLNDPLW